MKTPFSRRPSDEAILNLQQMDAATCASLMGHMNEYNECLVKARKDPDNPDTVVLEVLKYRKPGSAVPHRPVYQE